MLSNKTEAKRCLEGGVIEHRCSLSLFSKSKSEGLTLETSILLPCHGGYLTHINLLDTKFWCLTSPPARLHVEDSLETVTFLRSMQYIV